LEAAAISLGLASIQLAWSCQGEAQAPFEERLAKAPLAFVGKVESVDGQRVMFVVEHAIRGAAQGAHVEIKALPASTCAVSFAKGQRWVYGGPSASDPTYPLYNATDERPMAGLARQDDSKFNPKPSGQSCLADAQCQSVFLGCASTAANASGVSELKASADKSGATSRRCGTRRDVIDFTTPWCVQNVCGRWTTEPPKAAR
jgi:hypothetical protein